MSILPSARTDLTGPTGGTLSDVVGLILDKGLVIDIYVRVSRVGGREGESFIAPDEQRALREKWLKKGSKLVTKLEKDGKPRLIHTVRGVGYALREV